MPNIFAMILEVVLGGGIETAASEKAPLAVRVVSAILLLTICLGLFTLLLVIGMKSDSIMLVVTAFIVLLSTITLVLLKIRQIRDQ